MNTQPAALTENHRSFFYPPGGLMVWLFVLVELCTFGAVFCVFVFQMKSDPAMHQASQKLLNLPLATANTLVLITSGFLAALGVSDYKAGRNKAASNRTFGAAALGTLFLVLKSLEYAEKSAAGHTIDSNLFFSYYWAMTGFHFLHVVLGVGILLASAVTLRRGLPFADADVTPETGAAYWHMCDLIWLILFPVVYLLH